MAVDPFVAQLQALLSAEEAAATGARKQAVRTAYIDYGLPFDQSIGLGDLSFFGADIDEATKALAQQNTTAGLSQMARLQKEYDLSQKSLSSDLAARGMLESGELAWRGQQLAQGFKQNTYDLSKNVLEYLRGQYAGFQQGVVERNQRLLQAQQDAAMREQQRQYELQQMEIQRQSMAQQMQIAQMQMQADMAAAASAGGGGGGGWSEPAPAEQGGGGGGGLPTISSYEAGVMQQWGSTKAANRPDWVKAIFQAHPGFLANPGGYQVV